MKIVKRIILIVLVFSSFATSAQEAKVTRFLEMNAGMAYSPGSFAYPGASFLYGQTHNFKSGYLIEYEAGLAFPTVLTGKLGVGRSFENTESSIGVRLSPGTLYFQQRFNIKESGSLIFGLEYGPAVSVFGGLESWVFGVGSSYDLMIVNVGYRWHLVVKKR